VKVETIICGSDDQAPVEAGDSSPAAELLAAQELEPEPTNSGSAAGEALLASEATDFQATTKAQIVEFCSSVYGVELDGSLTKVELVQQATALEAQASGSSDLHSDGADGADLAAQELGDALLKPQPLQVPPAKPDRQLCGHR
jgi:hypothetical protein